MRSELTIKRGLHGWMDARAIVHSGPLCFTFTSEVSFTSIFWLIYRIIPRPDRHRHNLVTPESPVAPLTRRRGGFVLHRVVYVGIHGQQLRLLLLLRRVGFRSFPTANTRVICHGLRRSPPSQQQNQRLTRLAWKIVSVQQRSLAAQ